MRQYSTEFKYESLNLNDGLCSVNRHKIRLENAFTCIDHKLPDFRIKYFDKQING